MTHLAPLIRRDGLTERRILITGATGEIGSCVAAELAAHGAAVVATARNSERLSALLSTLQGENHVGVVADLQDEDLSQLFFEATAEGPLDGMVHCAGTSSVLPLTLLTRKRLLEDLQINYLSFIELMRNFTRKKNYRSGASVVVISSIAAEQPGKCQTSYAAAKSALNASIRALSNELAPAGIRLNSILPGAVAGNAMTEATNRGLNINGIEQRQILGLVSPDEVAQTVSYLLSPASSAMTGRSVYLDAGIFA